MFSHAKLLAVVVALTVVVFYFEGVYMHPSPGLCRFLQTVTVTDKPKLQAKASDIIVPESPDAANEGNLSPATAGAASTSTDVTGQWVNTSAEFISGKFDGSQIRFNSKLHMLNPLQLTQDYPVAWYLSEKLGFARLPWVSANLISISHPICALIAAICIARSALSLGVNSQNGAAPTESEMRRIARSPKAEDDGPTVLPVPGSPVQHEREGSTSFVQMDSGLSVVEHGTKTPTAAASKSPMAGTDPSAVATGVAIEDEDTPSAKKSYILPPVDMKLLRTGCLFFCMRNFLDSLDGVVARLHMRYRAWETGNAPTTPPTAFGFNGHSVDVATDFCGVVMCSCGILVFLHRRGTILSRIPAAILSRIPPLRHRTRSEAVGKVVAVAGLLYMAIMAGTWETYMIRYSNLFDLHANTNYEIFKLESSFPVRFNQLLWSVTCGDSVISILVVSLFFNHIWETVQFYCFFGYPWYSLVALHSYYVWHRVILTNPAAAKILNDKISAAS